MRLDKFISKATELSRKEAKKALHADQITVNGEPIRDGSTQINEHLDDIAWDGEPLSIALGNRYILLHKPEGYECTLKAKDHPIVTDLIIVPEIATLRIAGRLDLDTTGALLLSDDGQWLHKVTSPKHKIPKTYQITLADPMSPTDQTHAITQIAKGILLEGDTQKTAPAQLTFTDPTHATLTLTEGKYHQVKRMMAYFGNKVIALHRSHIGKIDLTDLQKGESRFLTQTEIAQF